MPIFPTRTGPRPGERSRPGDGRGPGDGPGGVRTGTGTGHGPTGRAGDRASRRAGAAGIGWCLADWQRRDNSKRLHTFVDSPRLGRSLASGAERSGWRVSASRCGDSRPRTSDPRDSRPRGGSTMIGARGMVRAVALGVAAGLLAALTAGCGHARTNGRNGPRGPARRTGWRR